MFLVMETLNYIIFYWSLASCPLPSVRPFFDRSCMSSSSLIYCLGKSCGHHPCAMPARPRAFFQDFACLWSFHGVCSDCKYAFSNDSVTVVLFCSF